jgi:hypothetical protein
MSKTIKQATIIQVFDARKTHQDVGGNHTRTMYDVFAKADMGGKTRNLMLSLYSEQAAAKVRAGETYNGFFGKPVKHDDREYFPFITEVQDNPSLQDGAPPAGPGRAAPGAGVGPVETRRAGAQYTLAQLVALYVECQERLRVVLPDGDLTGGANAVFKESVALGLFAETDAAPGGGAGAAKVSDDEIAGLQPTILKAIEDAQMMPDFESSRMTIEETVTMWKAAGGNAMRFCIALNERLAKDQAGPGQDSAGTGGGAESFDLPF